MESGPVEGRKENSIRRSPDWTAWPTMETRKKRKRRSPRDKGLNSPRIFRPTENKDWQDEKTSSIWSIAQGGHLKTRNAITLSRERPNVF